jgi:hypothetical protein
LGNQGCSISTQRRQGAVVLDSGESGWAPAAFTGSSLKADCHPNGEELG